LFAV
jgi:hypothetical protein